jgi:hypothetical protein
VPLLPKLYYDWGSDYLLIFTPYSSYPNARSDYKCVRVGRICGNVKRRVTLYGQIGWKMRHGCELQQWEIWIGRNDYVKCAAR